MRATVCLPTYNERENLESMVRALGRELREGDRVLVIDDASPDGTGVIADGLATELPFVSVLHRKRKEGLGPAYLAGFARALADGAELVLEMDCDFSHDPKDVPRLIAAAEDGADLVLGSRYVAGRLDPELGARAPRDLTRRQPLRAGHPAEPPARPDRRLQVFSPPGARDGRPGRDRLEGLRVPDRDHLPRRARPASDVLEVPIAFVDREHGHSKMNGSIVLEAVWKVPLLRFRALTGRL